MGVGGSGTNPFNMFRWVWGMGWWVGGGGWGQQRPIKLGQVCVVCGVGGWGGSDTYPFNVFRCGVPASSPSHSHTRTPPPPPPPCRPREKLNRPQTRRRRENSLECLDKMRTLRDNLLRALELAELLTFRERKKRDILVGYRVKGLGWGIAV